MGSSPMPGTIFLSKIRTIAAAYRPPRTLFLFSLFQEKHRYQFTSFIKKHTFLYGKFAFFYKMYYIFRNPS